MPSRGELCRRLGRIDGRPASFERALELHASRSPNDGLIERRLAELSK
jgi:predicted RNA polymerase sigma factor